MRPPCTAVAHDWLFPAAALLNAIQFLSILHPAPPPSAGGGQERGLRSGTVPTPLVVGLGRACEIAKAEMAADTAHVRRLEARLRDGIASRLQGVQLNGPEDLRHR